ncbi:MAG TPA: Ig-like domain-containing protein [Gaiellaceae bacterium]
MARRTLIVGISLVVFLVAGAASAGSGSGGKGGRDRTPPSVAIAAPAAGATVAGAVGVAGSAADNVKVAKVEVSVDGGAYALAQGTGSWSYAVDTTKLADGGHTLNARATDSTGNTSVTSEGLTVKNAVADTTPPTVSIVAPTSGATVAGTLAVAGSAGDNSKVASVAVSVDGGMWQAASGTTAWAASVDTTTLSDGSHVLRAQAIDAAGNAATTSESVSVRNDVSAPTVAFTSPASGASVSGAVTVTGSAGDDRQVAKVEVAVDGGAYALATGTSSWSYPLDTSSLAAGSHTLSARATDSSGNVGSATLSFSVAASSLPSGVVDQLVTPEGVTIQIYSGATGWTAQQIYSLLKANALELGRIGPTLTVRLQTQYASSTSASASETNGAYGNFKAIMSLQAAPGSVFTDRPDAIVAHEYGHVWTLYHLYMSQQGEWTKYLAARGIASDPRLDSTYNWSKDEMIADDYRLLFGTSAAQSELAYINPDVADPRTASGLRDFFLNVWAVP